MSALSDRLTRAADRVHLAEQFATRGLADQAAEHLAGLHDELLAIADEVA